MHISIDLLLGNIFTFQIEVSIIQCSIDSFNSQNYLNDITNEVSKISMIKGKMKFHSVFVKLECL